MAIRIDEKTTAESQARCPCGKEVLFAYQHAGGAKMTKHFLPVCEAFVQMDAETFEQHVKRAKAA